MLEIKLQESKQEMKPIHGVGNGPASAPFEHSRVQEFKDAGIPFSRLHDTEGYYGSGEYVNIHCIFKNFDADVNDPNSYNFKNTDIYIKHIIDAGTKVYYRLGETIENNPMGRVLPKHINPPKDFLKWAQICEHIIRHYNEGWADGFHYNIEYWEIWNEPDNTQMWTGTAEQFYEFYTVASKHLKKCFPNLKIGGVASSGFYAATRTNPSEWFKTLIPFAEGFMEYVKKHNAPLDFFSWHCYTHLVDEVKASCLYVHDFLEKYGYGHVEKILNEWNYALNWDGEEAKFRKSMKAAAMVAGSFIVMQDAGIDAAMYYDAEVTRISFCGLFNEYTFKPEKPYYAFIAFNELKKLGTQLKTDACNEDGYYALAAANENEKAVMLVNYDRESTDVVVDTQSNGKNAYVYLLDETHNLEIVSSFKSDDGKVKVTLPENSVVLVKIS